VKKNSLIKIAFGSVPKDGGTYSFYYTLRKEILKYNIVMYCVSVGKEQSELWMKSYADENCVLLAKNTYNVKKQSEEFVNWCIFKKINVVIGVNSEAILSSIPHLPKNIRVISRCANAFDHGYRITLSGGRRVQSVIALTPKLYNDLNEIYGVKKSDLSLIPNGVPKNLYKQASKKVRGAKKHLKLAFLGRLEHNQKGIMHIPEIVKELDKLAIDYKLTIAGKGKEEKKLKKVLEKNILNRKISLIGQVAKKDIPKFFSDVDIYLFPSHFEGCPNSLLEAKMAGCLCIAWKIEGITDYIIDDKKNGYLFKRGDYKGISILIKKLSSDRKLINRICEESIKDAIKRFDISITAKSYYKNIVSVLAKESSDTEVRDWKEFKPDENFRQTGDGIISRNFKVKLKRLLNIK
tara:strand:+ start:23619 stop:24839 length:1221 start_codon:yes stop_codon:yes gene_type:complete